MKHITRNVKQGKINELLTRGVEEVIDRKHLEAALLGGEKLRIKLGIDPTAPKIHLGRTANLLKLGDFQDLGHKAVLIIGDFTGLVGDASDKDSERPMMAEKQVKENMKTYLEQFGKILDIKKAEVHYNSKWFKKLGYLELIKQADLFGLHEITARENVAKRMKAGKRVGLREVLYPLMQGYDSVAIKSDVEIGGTDQRYNLLAGRQIQRLYGQNPQDIITHTLIEGTDGRKMSSSWGNVINILDEPQDMFGKVMAILDSLIIKYFTGITRVPLEEIAQYEKELKAGANPMLIKKRLADELVTMYHGAKAAVVAEKEFEKVFSKKGKPTDIPEMKVKSHNIIDVLAETKLASSKSEARRLVAQKGVKINDIVAGQSSEAISGSILQVGKRKFIKLK